MTYLTQVVTTQAGLPAAGVNGKLALVTDGVRGIWKDNGRAWRQISRNTVNPIQDWHAIGDGTTHPLSSRYGSLAAAQVDYPHATALTQEIDWAALQGAFNAIPDGSRIYLGSYKFFIGADTINLTGTKSVYWEGEGRDASGGTYIQGSAAGPIFEVSSGSGDTFGLEKCRVRNTNAAGYGVRVLTVGGALGLIRHCSIQAWRAIWLADDVFTWGIENTELDGPSGVPADSVGILAPSHTLIKACDIVGFDHGIRAFGSTVDIIGCRLEVNRYAIVLGQNASGGTTNLSRSVIAGNSMEANDYGISVQSLTGSRITACGMQGSVNSPNTQSISGLTVAGMTDVTISDTTLGGSFSDCGVRVQGSNTRTRLERVSSSNSYSGAREWDILCPIDPTTGVELVQTNYDPRGDGVIVPSLARYATVQALGSMDYTNGTVFGRNLRRKNVAVTETATTLAVVFTVGKTSGQAVISTATPAAGAGLPDGTYYLIGTAVNEVGETPATSEKTVVLSGGNNQISVALAGLGTSAADYKRRVYIGTAPGVYSGYYETAYGATSLTITNLTYAGVKSPPTAGNTDMTEPDANYAVLVTTSWETTFWVTAKATGGFTINFGSPAPASATVDWFIVR